MNGGTNHPVIKWSGSKRSVAGSLQRLWPRADPSRARYFEPFVGGGSMLPLRPLRSGVAGDTVPELVALWTEIRDRPALVADHYAALWERRKREGHLVFYEVRDRFNAERGALDLLFLSRMCVNGLIRFNARGEFNNSLHHTRPGIDPDRLTLILQSWSASLQGVAFHSADYRKTLASARAGDIAFLDPPYVGTKGRYHPAPFDFGGFYEELARLTTVGVQWIVTLDGHAGERTYESNVPADLYRVRLSIPTGNSPFTRLMNTSVDGVTESVYLNFDPPVGALSRCQQERPKPARARPKENAEQSDFAF